MPCYFADKEKASEAGKKSGLARANLGQQRKKLKDSLNILLNLSLKKGQSTETEDLMNLAEANKLNISVQDAIALSMIRSAMAGNVKAAEFVRDSLGEKPSDKIDLTADVTKTDKLEGILKQLED